MTQAVRISHSLLDPYLTTPLRAWYPFLALPKRLPPEAIVIAGHVCGVLAAISLALSPSWSLLAVFAGLFVVGHHLCDIFDGQHARATGQCRHGGELLDHFLDPLSISYLVLGWAWAAGTPALAIPGVLVVMGTAVLTNIKAKLGGAFELSRLGPTEFKAFMACMPIAAGIGLTFAPAITQQVLWWTLAAMTAAAVLRLPFELVAAVRDVNRSDKAIDTTEWINAA